MITRANKKTLGQRLSAVPERPQRRGILTLMLLMILGILAGCGLFGPIRIEVMVKEEKAGANPVKEPTIESKRKPVTEVATKEFFHKKHLKSHSGAWISKANMPTARGAFAVGVVNNKIYAIGGLYDNGTNEEYDPSTNSWTTRANMPTPRAVLAIGVVNNKIYAIGGWTATAVFSNKNEEYDPGSNTWTTKANMPSAISNFAGGVSNGKIYAIGGMVYYSTRVRTNYEYDPVADAWTTKANMPTGRSHFACGVIDNKIYAIGGTSDGYNALGTNEEYDPAGDVWTTRASMPTPRIWHDIGVINNRLYAIGGNSGHPNPVAEVFDVNEEYNPSTNSWATKANMPVGRFAVCVAVVNNSSDGTSKIYAIGGNDGNGGVALNDEFTPAIPQKASGIWLNKTNMPTARTQLAAGVVNNKIYAIGGGTTNTIKNANEEYDPATDSWTAKANMPTPRADLAIGVANGKIYAIGGGNKENDYLTTDEEYNPVLDIWTTKANMPTPRSCLTIAVVIDPFDHGTSKIYAIGGLGVSNNSLDTNEEYDPIENVWSTKANMPGPRNCLAVGVINNPSDGTSKIYAVGGHNLFTGADLTDNAEYNPQTNTWTKRAPMSVARHWLGVGVLNDSISGRAKLYALGGSTFDGNSYEYLDNNEEYDPVANVWTTRAPLPANRSGVAVAVVANPSDPHGTGKLYVIGGGDEKVVCNNNWEFTPEPAPKISKEWKTKANMPTGRPGLAIGVVNNKIYAIGGDLGADNCLATNEEYDPSTNSWATKASMPTSRTCLAIGVINNKIYALGGFCGDINYFNRNEEYNPSSDTWTPKANMPTARAFFTIGAVNNPSDGTSKIYAIGGCVYYATRIGTNEEYDPVSDTWTTKTSMPTARSHFSCGVVNNPADGTSEIYAIGGTSDGYNILGTNEKYNPVADNWTAQAAMPTPRLWHSIGVINNKIYAIGGSKYLPPNPPIYNNNEEYDPATDAWTAKPSMLTPRYNFAIGVVNNPSDGTSRIYAIGGGNQNEEYTPEVTKPSANWKTKANMPTVRSGVCSAVVNNKIYVIGGIYDNAYFNNNEEYDPASDSWSTKTPMPTARECCTAAAVSVTNPYYDKLTPKIYVIGGTNAGYQHQLNLNEAYDPQTNSWSAKAPMPTGRHSLCNNAPVLNNKIYIIGGCNLDYKAGANWGNLNQNEAYDPVENIWETKMPMPTKRHLAATVAVNGKIYVMGGSVYFYYPGDHWDTLNTNEAYDPQTNSWSAKAPMPSARRNLGLEVVNNIIYAIGGETYDESYVGKAFSANEAYDPTTDKWQSKPDLPEPRSGFGLGAVNGKIYIIGGGYWGVGIYNTNWEYTPQE